MLENQFPMGVVLASFGSTADCFAIAECLILPVLGMISLVWVQTCCSKTRMLAQCQFLLALVFVTVMTLRTVIAHEPMWLIHTSTLGVMVIAALFTPGQNATMSEHAT